MRDRLMRGAWLAALLLPAAAWGQGVGPGGVCPATGCVFPAPVTVPSLTTNTIQSTTSANAILFRNGVGGIILLRVGGSGATIEPDTNIALQGGVWGAGALVNQTAPIFQNAIFTGTTTGGSASFGAFLQQNDNSSNTNGVGFNEHLILTGSGVVGGRVAGQFVLDINAITGNAVGKQYVGLITKTNLMVTDGGGLGPLGNPLYSTAFGFNPGAHVGPGVTANAIIGVEINTWTETGAIVTDRIGLQVVDVVSLPTSFGVQATRDDVALSLNNQYEPSSVLGFEVGIGFGRFGGNFPVATNGTLIAGQANQGSGFTVANGIDWSLGTFTGNSWNDGHVTISGAGTISAVAYKTGATAGVTCASVTAASVTVANGIVTHC